MGLALYQDDRVLLESLWTSPDFHTVELAPAIQQALQRCQLNVSDISVIAFAIGPGSYTGLRIGLALAKGLAFTHDLPLIAVPTLDILAAAQPLEDIPLAAVLQAGRTRLAVGHYAVQDGRWTATGEPELMTLEELSTSIKTPTLLCGELYEEERRQLGRKRINVRLASPANSLRRPAILAELAWARFLAGENDLTSGLGPNYVQTQEAIPA
jgi:tRNA threonylcarbamoyladenosine biosynthesis protein TsaB